MTSIGKEEPIYILLKTSKAKIVAARCQAKILARACFAKEHRKPYSYCAPPISAWMWAEQWPLGGPCSVGKPAIFVSGRASSAGSGGGGACGKPEGRWPEDGGRGLRTGRGRGEGGGGVEGKTVANNKSRKSAQPATSPCQASSSRKTDRKNRLHFSI